MPPIIYYTGCMILVSDIDGTFYFHHRTPSFLEEDLKAIWKWQSCNKLFGVCTGRSDDSARIVLGDAVKPDFYIMTNGALIRDKEDKVLFSSELSWETVEEVFQLFSAYHPTYTSRKEGGYQKRFTSLEEYDGGTIESMSFYFKEKGMSEKLYPEVADALSGKANVFINTYHLDIAPVGVTKGTAAAFIRKHYQDEIAGIGDTFCDLPLLENAEVSFTFHSSPEDVKTQAGHLVTEFHEAVELLLELN